MNNLKLNLIVLVSSKKQFNLLNDVHHFLTKSLVCKIKKKKLPQLSTGTYLSFFTKTTE